MEWFIEFVTQYKIQGLLVGLATFLIIGLFHPIVIKGEYYFGNKVKWFFLILGIITFAASIWVDSFTLSALLGVTAFSSFWGIKEVEEQKERVKKGWFPANPKRKYNCATDKNSDKKAGSQI